MNYIKAFTEQVNVLRRNWEVLSVVITIERADALWPTLKDKYILISNLTDQFHHDTVTYRCAIRKALSTDSEKTSQLLDEFEELIFWSETELNLPLFYRCLVVIYNTRNILRLAGSDITIGISFTCYILIEAGYEWMKYIHFTEVQSADVSLEIWVIDFLQILRDKQAILLSNIEQCGVLAGLNMHEQLLLYIIGTYKGISTAQMVKKLGRSEATVRRMLVSLRRKMLISSIGRGKAINHYIT